MSLICTKRTLLCLLTRPPKPRSQCGAPIAAAQCGRTSRGVGPAACTVLRDDSAQARPVLPNAGAWTPQRCLPHLIFRLRHIHIAINQLRAPHAVSAWPTA